MDKAQRVFDAAILAEEVGQFGKALRLYKKASTLHTNSGAIKIRWATLLHNQGRLREAIRVARQVTRRWPKSDPAHSIIGRSYRKLGHLVKAERAFRQSLAAKSHPFTWVFLSETLLHQGRDKESKDCLRRALLLDHDYEEAHYNLGCAYKLSGQYALAERHLKRAIEIDPKYSLAYAELGHVWLLRKKGAKEAINFLRKSISYDPEYGWTRVYLANALWRLRKLKAADEQFRKVIEIWPNDSLSYWCYGDFLAYEGSDRSVAEKYLRKAIEMEPRCKLTNYYLGKHLHYWGRKEEGLKLLRRAQLGHPSAQKRLQAINQGRT